MSSMSCSVFCLNESKEDGISTNNSFLVLYLKSAALLMLLELTAMVDYLKLF